MVKALDEMRLDSAKKNKRGIAFIVASIFVWCGILIVHCMDLSIREKNLYTWYVVAWLMPIAVVITRLLKVKMWNKENPINQLGVLITLNEILYVLIACWVYSAVPEKMIMILAMIFGGHLLPFGWLYKSKTYIVSSILITIGIVIVGGLFSTWMVAVVMMMYEIVFALCLWQENRKLFRES